MKIMIFIRGYLPGEKYGGPVTSISNFVDALGDENDIRIICCNHDLDSKIPYKTIQPGWNQVEKAQVFYFSDKELNFRTFNRIISEEKPDIIYASGIYCIKFNAPMIKAAKKNNVPVLLAPRGDICDNAIKIKSYKKKFFLAILKISRYFKNIYFHATMQEEVDNLEKYLGIKKDRIFLALNIPSTLHSHNDYLKEKDVLKLLFVSRIQSKKNLLYAIRVVNKVKLNVVFDIYGPLENQEYWNECQEEMNKAPNNIRINYCGALKPIEAKHIYSNYDAFIFPTLSENYGHVIAESLLHECPIILSKGTTPWDDIFDYGAGFICDLNEESEFINSIESMAKMDNDDFEQVKNNIRKYIKYKINYDELIEEYYEIFSKCK